MTSHSGHRKRMRQRFLETGTKGFSDHELLELILFYTLPRVNTNNIAHELIKHFGSINEILNAEPEKLEKINGIGNSSSVFFSLISDICKRYTLTSRNFENFSSQEDIQNWFKLYFKSIQSEICVILSLGMNMKIISTVSFPAEHLSADKISARELAEISLRNNFNRIILGLNHPHKPPLPTETDYFITNKFAEILNPLGIEIYDCIISGNDKIFSMRQNGAFSFNTEVNGII